MEVYPGLPSYCLIHPFSVIITEFRNKRLKKLINSKYVSVDKKTGLKIWHTPGLNFSSSELEFADFGLTIKMVFRAES